MIFVKEQVFKDDGTIEYETEKSYNLKFNFLNQFKKIKGVSSFTVAQLSENNTVTFEMDGVKRKIDITPQVYLGKEDLA